MTIEPEVILASQSPRRRELLALIGLAHEVRPADIDESYLAGESPEEHCERLARGKAETLARRASGDAVIIGSDTIVVVDGEILGQAGGCRRCGADAADVERPLARRADRRRGSAARPGRERG